jgi:hypothetical protein
MAGELLLRFDDPDSNLGVVIEDDGRVAYAYLLDHRAIIGEVWLYNRAAAPQVPGWNSLMEAPPYLNPEGYIRAADFAVPVSRERCGVEWGREENGAITAHVLIEGKRVARLCRDSKPGWSCLAVKDGPLARCMPQGSSTERNE